MANLRRGLPRLAMATSWFFYLFLLCLVFAVPALDAREISTETTLMEGAQSRASRRPSETELIALQDRLGYNFTKVNLLIDALTHASYSEANNEVLHVLGGKSVQQAIALYLVLQNPDVTKSELDGFIRKHSNATNCAEDAAELKLEPLIIVGKGVKMPNLKILSDAFNAVFGAITVDDGPTTANIAYWKVKKWNDRRVDTI
jgi:ribonuclease-3